MKYVQNITELEVYNKALELLPELYKLLTFIPKDEFDLKTQIRKAAQSVPSNIAEGFGKKNSSKEFKRFLQIALGSNDELVSHLRIVQIIQPYLQPSIETLIDKYILQSKRINTLHKNWK